MHTEGALLEAPAATSRGVVAAPARRRARWARGRPRYGLARLHPLAALACIGALLAAGLVLANPVQLAGLLVLEMAALALSASARPDRIFASPSTSPPS